MRHHCHSRGQRSCPRFHDHWHRSRTNPITATICCLRRRHHRWCRFMNSSHNYTKTFVLVKFVGLRWRFWSYPYALLRWKIIQLTFSHIVFCFTSSSIWLPHHGLNDDSDCISLKLYAVVFIWLARLIDAVPIICIILLLMLPHSRLMLFFMLFKFYSEQRAFWQCCGGMSLRWRNQLLTLLIIKFLNLFATSLFSFLLSQAPSCCQIIRPDANAHGR